MTGRIEVPTSAGDSSKVASPTSDGAGNRHLGSRRR